MAAKKMAKKRAAKTAKRVDLEQVRRCIKTAGDMLDLLEGFSEDCGDEFARAVELAKDALGISQLHLSGDAEPEDDAVLARDVEAFWREANE